MQIQYSTFKQPTKRVQASSSFAQSQPEKQYQNKSITAIILNRFNFKNEHVVSNTKNHSFLTGNLSNAMSQNKKYTVHKIEKISRFFH